MSKRTTSSSSDSSSPSELSTPSLNEDLLEPSILTNNIPLPIISPKCSIHHQDAEASIADATDCLRMISGKTEWFHRKHHFCPHLVTGDDIKQITELHRKILLEELPFIELHDRLRNGLVVDIPKELQGRISNVCVMFTDLKNRIDDLITNVNRSLPSPNSFNDNSMTKTVSIMH
ncbi:hypothetical protein SSS_01553 [Sarcoptes scabiei]|uniref:Uncharacterized protein n=1 Tax=Sarcoptes scabiei TaxID=52283 RepID=A0A131ZUU5_SARSC|nr:hypothetical protein SSS_01553 [Sarcoptes scabiei]KPM02371.1 hypothetical protein QR98_0007830 [Sarcoptes scabiei]